MSTATVTFFELLKRLSRSPLVISLCSLLGILCGGFYPQIATKMNFIGDIYLSFLGLISVPFLFSALSSSLVNLIQNRAQKQTLLSAHRMVLFMFVLLVLTGGVFYGVGRVFTGCFADSINVEHLDMMLSQDSSGLDEKVVSFFIEPAKASQKTARQEFSFSEFLQDSIPKNIFLSLVENNILHILIVTVFFGIALGLFPEEKSRYMVSVLNVVYESCITFVGWSTYFMPLCVFSLLGKAVSVMDRDVIQMTSSLLGVYLLSLSAMILLFLWLWARSAGISLRRLLKEEGRVLLLAFCTRQRLVVLPMLIQDMREKQKLSEKGLNIIMPFSFTVGMAGFVAPYVFMTTVIAHLYGVAIPITLLVLICVLTPFLSIGGGYPIYIVVLLDMLNLPSELALLLLCSMMPIEDPFITLYNVVFNSWFSTLCLKKAEQRHNGECGL